MKNRPRQKRRVQRAIVDSLEPRWLLSSTIYVDGIAPGSNDGSSWANAYKSLQSALAVATSGDTIEVGQGTYYPTSGTSQTATFQLINGVSILGGYAGYGTSNPDARDVATNATILSGNINGNNTGNSYHVVTGSNVNSTADLDGFTVSDGGGGTTEGGGMYNSGGSPTITDCTFTANTVTEQGAGMFNTNSSPTLTGCTFSFNSISQNGGVGAGMEVLGSSSPILTNCVFLANSTSFAGGALNNNGTCELIDCLFDSNVSQNQGGAISSGGPLTLVNCTFAGNMASLTGSGGGAIYVGGPTTLTNCICYDDTGFHGEFAGNIATVTYSDIEGGYSLTGNINADPLFGRVPGTNGATDYGNLELQAASPCVDSGSISAVPTGLTTDLDGYPRTENGTVDMGAYEFQTAYTPASQLAFTQQPGDTIINSGVGPKVAVSLEDENGNLDLQDYASITLSILKGPAGGVLGGTATVGAVDGVATFSDLELNTVGTYKLLATDMADHLTVASTKFTVGVGAPSKLVFTKAPAASAVANAGTHVRVDVEDKYGNIVSTVNGKVTLSISGSGSGATLNGASSITINAVDGVAAFGSIGMTKSGNYTLLATHGSLPGVTSSFTITPGAAAMVVFARNYPPSSTAAGAVNVVAKIKDAFGNLVTTANGQVTLSIASGPTGGTLGGTTTVDAVNGVATFNVTITKAGNYTTLQATYGSLPAASFGITVTPDQPSQLVFAPKYEPSSVVASTPIAPGIVVKIKDIYGNVVTSDNVIVLLSIDTGPAGASLTGAIAMGAVNGVATFNDVSISTVGAYTLKATQGSLPAAVSSSFNVTAPAPPADESMGQFQEVDDDPTMSILS
jgi:predicted outer membrane repeat protein